MGRKFNRNDVQPFIHFLKQEHYSIPELAKEMGCTVRTVYRKIDQMEWMDIGLDRGDDNRYFIVDKKHAPTLKETINKELLEIESPAGFKMVYKSDLMRIADEFDLRLLKARPRARNL